MPEASPALSVAALQRILLLWSGMSMSTPLPWKSLITSYPSKKVPYAKAILSFKGFDFGSLYKYCRFYKLYPEILDSVSPKSGALLSWTHYRVLLQVEDKTARDWYAKEASEQTWSVRTLQRNISSQYYYRLLKSQNPEPVKQEMKKLTVGYQAGKLEFIKNPMITEFLGLSGNTDFTESKLESCIITNIQKFLMELGKGYAFVPTEEELRAEIETQKEIFYLQRNSETDM